MSYELGQEECNKCKAYNCEFICEHCHKKALEKQAKDIFKKFIKDLNRIDKSSYCGLDNSEVTSDVIDKLKKKYGVKWFRVSQLIIFLIVYIIYEFHQLEIEVNK